MGLSYRYKILLIAALGLISSGIFVLFLGTSALGPDATQYDRLGYNLASGCGFSLSESGPFLPTMYREPVYPFFLAAFYGIFGHDLNVVLFIQMIMHALTALITFYLAKEAFSEKTAFYSAVIVAIFPTLANTSAYILSETLFTFNLYLGIYVYSVGLKTGKVLPYLAAGALFGILALTKAIALFLPIFLAAAALCIGAAKKLVSKRLLFNILSFLAVFALTVSPWSVRNKALFNTYSLTVRSGEVLWSRAAKLDYPLKKALADACYNFSEFLGNKFFPDPGVRPERYLYRDLDRAEALRASYRKEGLTEPQADAIIKKEAMAKISKHPFKYLSYGFVEAIKMTAFTYLPLLNEPRVSCYFDSIRNGHLIAAALKGIFRLVALPLLFLFILGVLKNFGIWDRWLLMFTVVFYFNAICSLLDALGRYGIPLIPLYCIFAAAAFNSNRRISA